MNIPAFSVDRRVTISMIVMIILVFGFISLQRLGLDMLPDIDYPIVTIITRYSGVSSEDIEATVTQPIEQAIAGVSNLKKMSSSSIEGVSQIQVEFEWGTDLNYAAQDLRDAISLVRDFLPQDISEPYVVKFNLGAIPILFYGVTGNMDSRELKKILEEQVADRLKRLDGVASISFFGERQREIEIQVDITKLEGYRLTFDQIVMAIQAHNLNMPTGYVTQHHKDYLVRTVGEYASLTQIGKTLVGSDAAGKPIRLSDVAEVKDGTKEIRNVSRSNGREGVMMMASKQSGANTVKTVENIHKELAKITPTLPKGIEFNQVFDQANIISNMTSKTIENGWVGALLAIFFMLLFLRNWRPTLIIAMAIPISVIVTFISIYAAGYTLNMMTLGGLALGVGMLVDNAVVVIENTFRHLEAGKDRKSAAKTGATEVGMAITASTITTIIVFLPIALSTGLAAKLVRGLAMTVSFALFASLFVALSIVPMMASNLFVRKTPKQHFGETDAGWFDRLKAWYSHRLNWCLDNQWKTLGVVVLLFAASLVFTGLMGKEFMPQSDRPFLMLQIKMPVGTSLDETDRFVKRVETVLSRFPSVKSVNSNVGAQQQGGGAEGASAVNEAMVMVSLKDLKDRDGKRSKAIQEEMRAQLPRLAKGSIEFIEMSGMGQTGSAIQIKVLGRDLQTLENISGQIAKDIKKVPGAVDVSTTMEQKKPEIHVKVDPDKASRSGLSVYQVGNTAQVAMMGKVASRYRSQGEEVDIRVRLKKHDREFLEDIGNLPISSPITGPMKLKEVASIEKGLGPVKIERDNQRRIVTVNANVADRDLAGVVKDIKQEIAEITAELPSGYFVEFGGQYEDMIETFISLGQALAIAILLVYMVMASQFESFTHPFIVMFTMPLAYIGVPPLLMLFGKTLSVASFVGIVVLAGIVVNNGIVLIDYVNQLRRKGLERREALLEGGMTRLRPILITAGTTILGTLPMALSQSEGSEMRGPMALTIMGGLTTSALLTLIVIPVVYSRLDIMSHRLSGRIKKAVLKE